MKKSPESEKGRGEIHCKRCHSNWTPYTPSPFYCPRCKSPYWNSFRLDLNLNGCERCKGDWERSSNKDRNKEKERRGNGLQD